MGFAEKSYGQSFKEIFIFLKQYLRNPRKTGSIYPSSPALGKAMVSFLEDTQQSTVIELGPGTGSITKTLLKSSISLDNFYACEISSVFAKHLRKRFPGIHVREGDASELTQVFAELVGKVDCIFSSLPLKSLPSALVEQIIDQEYEILKPQGIVIQFTYDLRPQKTALTSKFKHIGSSIVTANFPPARVDAFIKE
ncbi:MAG: phospholipid N-methyltransferase [Lentimonas sp.]|jgi:phospholipid N-methyltransferase